MKLIPLSGGKAHALVDDQDYEWLSKFSWTLQVNKKVNVVKQYAARWETYYTKRGKKRRRKKYMHREIMKKELEKAPPKYVVDHGPDKSGLNNQRNNMRVCSHADNLKDILDECRGCGCSPKQFNPLCCPDFSAPDRSGEW